jgi:predicted signal transduction protein with EAL and GGDEF domain
MSIGIAVFPDHALDSDTLEQAADRALYAAKNAGRDRIESFNGQNMTDRLPTPPQTANGSTAVVTSA